MAISIIHVGFKQNVNGIYTVIDNISKYNPSPEIKHRALYMHDIETIFKRRVALERAIRDELKKGNKVILHLHISDENSVYTTLEAASKVPYGVPIVYTAHSVARDELRNIADKFPLGKMPKELSWGRGQDILFNSNIPKVKWLVRRYTFVSPYVKESFRERYSKIMSNESLDDILSRGDVINNGSDMYKYYANREVREHLQEASDKVSEALGNPDFIIIAPYRLCTAKGLDKLIVSYSNLVLSGDLPKNSKLLLVGSFYLSEVLKYQKMLQYYHNKGVTVYSTGKEKYMPLAGVKSISDFKRKLSRITQRYDITRANIIYLGKTLSREILAILYMSSDLMVMPTLFETFGYPVVEAAMMGTPSAVSNLGGPKMLFIDEGLAIPIYDPTRVESVTCAILVGYDENNKWKRIIRKRYNEIVWRFSAERMAQDYARLYMEKVF